ncbi:fumarate reductase flavoprotein subunit [Trinickia symbiotica]|uniref:FAD-binding protein n=1 Tax=Trinickia symbiotica TaxID=863227 RepID=A0A2N7WNG7_9BURK|nr:FAD-dependent oxidoreductase [Trinickia symbiotica]PMS30881.1 FAD-binding protein [Trinickia symbiotica]PPK41665.1 fumarate reductase flavoprotein subunit [Trinickia symbiotica]
MDYDVIVVGGGGAGLSAAIAAAKAGASVMLVEADTKLGGATALSSGVVYAAGTAPQRAAGIEDTPEAMFNHLMSLNQWSIRPALARILAYEGASIIDWLIELGNDFPPHLIVESGVGGCPRGHQSINSGYGIVQSLINHAGPLGVEVALGSRVGGLLMEDGAVVGIRAEGTELRAPSVVITTGGFGNSPQMIERLWPTAAAHGERVFSIYHEVPFNVGDGIRIAEDVGARITGINNGLLTPNSALAPYDLEAFFPEWAMVVNRYGQRFAPEDASYAISGYLINDQPGMHCFVIFDDAAFLEACAEDIVVKHYVNDPGPAGWRVSVIRRKIQEGRVKMADTLEELAQRADINAAGLIATVERYNRFADAGKDEDFLKSTSKFYPIRRGPFYAVKMRASTITSCHAGLDIDNDGRVLDRSGTAIRGLYAAGEVLGCTLGRRYVGGGIGVANALTFGRLAGASAARDAKGLRGAAERPIPES